MDQTPLDALNRAINIAGSQAALAKLIGVKQQNVSYWVTRNGRAPAEYVAAIEAATSNAVRRHELRPDIYPKAGVAA